MLLNPLRTASEADGGQLHPALDTDGTVLDTTLLAQVGAHQLLHAVCLCPCLRIRQDALGIRLVLEIGIRTQRRFSAFPSRTATRAAVRRKHGGLFPVGTANVNFLLSDVFLSSPE